MNKRYALRGLLAVIICLMITVTVYARTEIYFMHVDDI